MHTFHTVCSASVESFPSSVVSLVCLPICRIPSVMENVSNIAKIAELEGPVQGSEQRTKNFGQRVKVAEDAVHIVSEVRREHSHLLSCGEGKKVVVENVRQAA